MRCELDERGLRDAVAYQMRAFWNTDGPELPLDSMRKALQRLEYNFHSHRGKYMHGGKEIVFDRFHTVQYAIFLYTLSHQLFLDGDVGNAAKVYYLNKIMHAVEWFYEVQLPDIFGAEHPVGSVIGRASIGDYLFFYQGTTIGGSIKNGIDYYPTIGDHVLMYADSKILGHSNVGSYVVLAAGTEVVNEDVCGDCIVFGKSPNLVIKQKPRRQIADMMKHIWGSDGIL